MFPKRSADIVTWWTLLRRDCVALHICINLQPLSKSNEKQVLVGGVQLPVYLRISPISVVTLLDHKRPHNFAGLEDTVCIVFLSIAGRLKA